MTFSSLESPTQVRTTVTELTRARHLKVSLHHLRSLIGLVCCAACAGIYVPTLANRIVDGNAAGNPHINLKGIAVGDGCIGNSVGTCGDGGDSLQILIDFYAGHGMVSQAEYAAVYTACGDFRSPSRQCRQAVNAANRAVGRIDVYNV